MILRLHAHYNDSQLATLQCSLCKVHFLRSNAPANGDAQIMVQFMSGVHTFARIKVTGIQKYTTSARRKQECAREVHSGEGLDHVNGLCMGLPGAVVAQLQMRPSD